MIFEALPILPVPGVSCRAQQPNMFHDNTHPPFPIPPPDPRQPQAHQSGKAGPHLTSQTAPWPYGSQLHSRRLTPSSKQFLLLRVCVGESKLEGLFRLQCACFQGLAVVFLCAHTAHVCLQVLALKHLCAHVPLKHVSVCYYSPCLAVLYICYNSLLSGHSISNGEKIKNSLLWSNILHIRYTHNS